MKKNYKTVKHSSKIMDLNSSSTQVVVTSQMKHTVTSNVMLGRISIDYSLNKPCLLSP